MRVLFVCAGNICRSPMAEALLRRIAADRPGLQGIDVASAGTIAIDGNSATREAQRAVREAFGITLRRHRAQYLTADLEADLVLTVDRSTTREARARLAGTRVELLGDYAGSPGEEVEDPYGFGQTTFDDCLYQLARLVEAVADRLERELTSASGAPTSQT